VKEGIQNDNISTLTLKAPAKINLFLKILNRRSDGYHGIESLMQKIELFDILHLSKQGEGISLSCPGTSLPEDQGNLVYRAAEAFFSATGIRAGVRIVLEKNIPIAAGLGGGSSDAATVITGLNNLLNARLGQQQLYDIAQPLGADIPFFVQDCSAALATGIGDSIQQVAPIQGITIVLVNPGFEVSTKWVYENFPLTSNSNPYILARGRKTSKNIYTRDPGLYKKIGNDLEAVTINRYPGIGDIKNKLKKTGAITSLMSGSGPTVFGLFHSEEDAQHSYKLLSEEYGGNVFLARPYIP